MKAILLGIGQCGNKIVDACFMHSPGIYAKTEVFRPLLINTAEPDLRGCKHIPKENKLLIGQSVVRGHGVGTDNTLAAKIANREIDTILEHINNLGPSQVDAFFLIGALGGGTGSGVMPVLGKALRSTYGTKVPVIAVAVFPARMEGELMELNTGKSFVTLQQSVDGILLVDNDKFIHRGETLERAYRHINMMFARELRLLVEASESKIVAESVVDAGAIINTICGMHRINAMLTKEKLEEETLDLNLRIAELAVIGHAYEHLPKPKGFFRKQRNDLTRKADRLIYLTKGAINQISMDATLSTATQGLVVIVAPRTEMDPKGIAAMRSMLREEVQGDVRCGDYPTEGNTVEIVLAIGGLTEVPRVREVIERAKVVAAKRPRQFEQRKSRVEELIANSKDIPPLL
ncbi:MAG: hypothetical protein QXW18_06235 [Candidatus Bathyarchaeia archaeon]